MLGTFSKNWILGMHMWQNGILAKEIEAVLFKYIFSLSAE